MYADINELEKKLVVTDYPLNIAIEITNHCNLNCVMCNNDKMKRKKGIISVDLYKKIIDETAEVNPATRIWLDFYGEALIAGWKLYYLIDYAKKKGLTNVCINTNGILMKKEYADMLLDAGTDYISLDCDGFSKEVYEAIRVNGNRDVFYQNVDYLLKKKKNGNYKTIVDIKIIDMEKNHDEIPQILEYWRSRGAWTAVRKCSSWASSDNEPMQMSDEGRIACGHAVGIGAITWDGLFSMCSWDYDLDMPIAGDVNKESIKEIWKKRNDTFLKKHFEHSWDSLPSICKNCMNWMNIGEERWDENGNAIIRNYRKDEHIF